MNTGRQRAVMVRHAKRDDGTDTHVSSVVEHRRLPGFRVALAVTRYVDFNRNTLHGSTRDNAARV
jgi:hypothetical protein